MLKWLIALFAAVLVVGLMQPRLTAWLRRGRLPGDVRLRLRGRDYVFPFVSVLLLSLVATLILRLL
ncbi:MAG: hypothetical protein A2045_13285 [Rhodocyclales bacterium GWA2_65_20]|nr:MAG: hypothetical protein A2045_13285 [Rhodocyclales bacterium GWA2_65_20]